MDSIAAPIRHDFDSSHSHQRQALLSQAANGLKMLANSFDIPIVVTNQVCSSYGQASKGQSVASSSASLSAALGVSWAHAVNTRFVLEDGPGGLQISLGKSPMFQAVSIPYTIRNSGFHVIELK